MLGAFFIQLISYFELSFFDENFNHLRDIVILSSN